VTYAELGTRVAEIGLGLTELGMRAGDRIAILCETRHEWSYTQLAITTAGAVLIPIYPSSSPSECRWVLENSGASMVVCENDAQLAKIAAVRGDLPQLERVIVIDPGHDQPDVLGWDEVRCAGDAGKLWTAAESVRPEDPCLIIYTSGTTGKPKGCVLSHRNIRATLDALETNEPIRCQESTYVFLPLAHVFSLGLQLLCLDVGGCLAFWNGDPTRIIEEIQEIQPTYFPAIPRIFEKIYGRFAPKLRADLGDDGLAKLVSIGCEARAAQYAGREISAALRREWEAADTQVFAAVRSAFGGKIRQAATGAAPIDHEILRFFYAAGIPLLEGYGMTETATAITVSTPEHVKFGTVGKPLPHLEVQVAEDNEILVKGPSVFEGYYGNEEATAEAIVDGWLHTGDLGALDDDGYLSIIGRKKDIIITSGGKNIAPSRLEDDVKRCPYVSQAVMHGDRRPYPTMLITLDPEEISVWARERGKPTDPGALVHDPDVVALIQQALDDANANHAKAAQVKKFFLLERQLSPAEGELTPSMKVKRDVVNTRFAAEFDQLY
jgi:long-chain acyl-CoA synthetase